MQSLRDRVAALPPAQRREWADQQPPHVLRTLATEPWWYMRRETQAPPPGDWHIWLILTGRGWGKSRTGSETLVDWALDQPEWQGQPTQWAVVAANFPDARSICVEGPSGILAVLKRRGIPYTYNRSLWFITLPAGQRIHLQAADKNAARGLNLSGVWCDETGMWRYGETAWHEGINPALRIGDQPRAIITTTPKPVPLIREWAQRFRDGDPAVVVTRGSTYENAANLSTAALEELKRRYEGTRIGRQELHGEILEDVEGALWTMHMIDEHRERVPETIEQRVVAVDPAAGEGGAETGIVVTSRDARRHFYVEADYSLRGTPDTWAKAAVSAYYSHDANYIVVEANQGGDMAVHTLRTADPSVPVKKVWASRGKKARAEPVSAIYEQGRAHHVQTFPALEDQLTMWVPEDSPASPDRLDALVWGITWLDKKRDLPLAYQTSRFG